MRANGAWVGAGLFLVASTLGTGALAQATRPRQAQPAPSQTRSQTQAQPRPAAADPATAAAATRPAAVASTGEKADPARAARMEQILNDWAELSRSNQTLFAQFTRTDRSPTQTEGPKVYEGEALLHKPNMACIQSRELVKEKKDPIFKERIVCSGDQVYHFLGGTKQVFVYPLAADERRRALEEGPLPLIFNMKVDAARQRYRWELLDERAATKTTPASYIIQLVPLHDIDREEFTFARLMLNKETLLPEALQLTMPNGKDTKTYVFKNAERNGENNAATRTGNYDGEQMCREFEKYGYKIIVNPDLNGDPQPAPSGGVAASTGGRAAAAPANRKQPATR